MQRHTNMIYVETMPQNRQFILPCKSNSFDLTYKHPNLNHNVSPTEVINVVKVQSMTNLFLNFPLQCS